MLIGMMGWQIEIVQQAGNYMDAYGGHDLHCPGLGALSKYSQRLQDFPTEVPFVTRPRKKWPCPIKDEIQILQ